MVAVGEYAATLHKIRRQSGAGTLEAKGTFKVGTKAKTWLCRSKDHK